MATARRRDQMGFLPGEDYNPDAEFLPPQDTIIDPLDPGDGLDFPEPPGGPVVDDPPAPTEPAYGQYLPVAFDEEKFYGDHDSPKYQILRALSKFDPTGGLTPEVIAALNALGIGEFEAIDEDELRIKNADPRFEGYTDLDLIQGFDSGAGRWNYGIQTGDEGGGGGAGGMVPLGGSFTGGHTAAGGAGGGFSGGSGGASDVNSILQQLQGSINLPGTDVGLDSILKGLLTGDLNQDIIGRRVESAREDLERARSSELDTDRAILAERGLIGSGPEETALTKLSEDLFSRLSGTTRDIYADEAGRADNRMLAALSAATGLSIEQVRQLTQRANLATQRDLGFGDLDLRRTLGLGSLSLQDLQTALQNQQFYANLGLQRELGNDSILARIIELLSGSARRNA